MKNDDNFFDKLIQTKTTRRNFIKMGGASLALLTMPKSVQNIFAKNTITVALLGTADLHGRILNWDYLKNSVPPARSGFTVGLSRINSLIKKERQKYPHHLLVDNGDIIQGTALDKYYATKDKNWHIHPMMSIFNYMNYDAINLGNHEFNFGLDLLKRFLLPSKAPCLSANTYDIYTNHPWKYVKPYTIKKIDVSSVTNIPNDSIRIGIIGTVTPAIPNFETPQNYQGLKFIPQEDAINTNISLLKNNVDAIVILSHSGIPSASSPYPENGIVAITKKCPGIDLILSGHTHVRTAQNMTKYIRNNTDSSVNPPVVYADGIINNIYTMAPYRWGTYLSEGLLDFAKVNGKWKVQNISTKLLSSNDTIDDPIIVNTAQKWDKATKAYLSTKLGTSRDNYYGKNGNKMYTPIVDFINKVQMNYGKADVSAAASFNPSALIPKGTITLQNILSIYIYENYLFTIKITGKQLRQYLELSASYFDQVPKNTPVDGTINLNYLNNVTTTKSDWPSYNYDMLTGVNYDINISKTLGNRIQNLTYTLTNKPVSDDDTIRFAINNYRFNGGGPLIPKAISIQSKKLSGFMNAMGIDSLGRNNLPKPIVLWSSQKSLADNGQISHLIAAYIKTKKIISPSHTANWHIISN
ncbi:bifunctional metallophosphatase/5'-nucleotidase [Pectinatus sottacetonis]|uniref:bifunctional metallophosphatase/5'-nucleotidase n=1 Tax=Pectinatus sottacetonis TaxID=1002795 RepID=UPI0018C59361|nr:5'-nucleotidase C-terminal domain-containing protein [Pectinatus sottacetonis]